MGNGQNLLGRHFDFCRERQTGFVRRDVLQLSVEEQLFHAISVCLVSKESVRKWEEFQIHRIGYNLIG